ncbi:transporter substrate-binding domain-containing protein [Desulfococcaceae bacterium HSG7]|nr:transporter substrate-binding domain-containing protein [Desulfococcaceae bacterium HSG7]
MRQQSQMALKRAIFILLFFQFSVSSALPIAAAYSRINIAIKEFPPFVFKERKGFCIDMAEIICEKNNLTPRFVRYNSVQEVLAAVESGECHIGFSGITITAEREKCVDFSQPFFDSGLTVAIRNEPSSGNTNTFITIMTVIGYSTILFFIGITSVAHLIWFIEKNDSNPKSFDTHYTKGIWEAYWWAVVTMTTVGYGDKCPQKLKGRFVASIWMLIGIVWFAGFTATLSSSLTVEKIDPEIIKGLTDINDKYVAVIRGTTSEKYLRFHNVKMVLADNLDDLVGNLKNMNADAMVYDAPALMYIAKNDSSVKVVGEMFDKQKYGVVFPQSGLEFYKELFNIAIIEMQQNGEYQRIYNKWF